MFYYFVTSLFALVFKKLNAIVKNVHKEFTPKWKCPREYLKTLIKSNTSLEALYVVTSNIRSGWLPRVIMSRDSLLSTKLSLMLKNTRREKNTRIKICKIIDKTPMLRPVNSHNMCLRFYSLFYTFVFVFIVFTRTD